MTCINDIRHLLSYVVFKLVEQFLIQESVGFNPSIAPESGIFPERFLPGLFERTKADVIHRLAGRSGKLGEKIPGKTG